jgi:hypothetical protein
MFFAFERETQNMGWRFRKSFSPLPGVRLNFSPRGISTSVGAGPFRFYVGSKGAAVTTRIPGTGISYRQPLALPHSSATQTPEGSPHALPDRVVPNAPAPDQIHSASTSTLTTEGLEPVKELLTKAQDERARLIPELHSAQTEAARLQSKHKRWESGWLLRRLFGKYFARLSEMAAEAAEKEAELEEQERQSRLATEFDLPEKLKDSFGRVCDAVAALSQSERIWDTISSVETDRYRERTTAHQSIQRKQVAVALGSCDLIESFWKVPHLLNANGGELFFYPAFILYFVSKQAFALVDLRDVRFSYHAVSFIEEEAVPRDAELIGHTWKKANKDGSPDRRFANNYQIPILKYGDIRLTSKNGLNEAYMISNAVLAQRFAEAFTKFQEDLPTLAA